MSEGADAERVIRQLASTGHDLIFTTSFGFMNPTVKVAKKFPKVKFEHCSGYKRGPNVSTYLARFYEGRTISGLIAGKMTKSNVIGYIASFPIPEVVRGINAFTLALREVNPKAEVKVVWVNTWYDPGKEGDAAKALIDQGADVILQHTDSPAPAQIAQKRGVWAVGQASDMTKFAPKSHLTAIIDDWNNYYVARTKAGTRRYLEVARIPVAGPQYRHDRDGALQPGDSEGRGRARQAGRGRHQVRQAPPLPGAGEEPGRQSGHSQGQGGGRQDAALDGLVRRGRAGQAARQVET